LTPYALRPANSSDVELAYEITRDAMREYVIQTWGNWNEDEQREKHQQNFTPSTYRIVIYNEEEVGLLAVENEPTHLWLVKLYLRSSFRRLGLGTRLLQQVIQEATELGKPIRLRVLRVNQGARRLYQRHGFAVVGEEAERLFMVRSASGA
jgi:GNAT superfamily N-acetyltransferase